MKKKDRQYQVNIISAKRELRRSYGWPSGRQWKRIRRELRRIGKSK